MISSTVNKPLFTGRRFCYLMMAGMMASRMRTWLELDREVYWSIGVDDSQWTMHHNLHGDNHHIPCVLLTARTHGKVLFVPCDSSHKTLWSSFGVKIRIAGPKASIISCIRQWIRPYVHANRVPPLWDRVCRRPPIPAITVTKYLSVSCLYIVYSIVLIIISHNSARNYQTVEKKY